VPKQDTASWYDFKVLMFGPRMSASGTRARINFKDDVLEVNGPGIWITVLVDQVTLRPGGYDGRQWMLTWVSEEGTLSALLTGESDLRMMASLAPASIARQIEAGLKTDRSRHWRFRLLAGLIVAGVLLPCLLVLLFWINSERFAGWVAAHVGVREETRLGELAFAQLRPSLRLVEGGPALGAVREIGERLTVGSRYRYHWYLADSPEVNAFALPGGYVVVYTGLLRAADSAGELAGVLAHEAQHVELRHSLKNLIHDLGWRAVLAAALGDYSGGVWADMAHRLGTLKYGRDLEREADRLGMEALVRAGIDPQGMATFFARLAAREGASIALLSTHPASEERMRTLRQASTQHGRYAYRPLPYDWRVIRARLPAIAPP
jgi:Zn-dependent protease with chaperone function